MYMRYYELFVGWGNGEWKNLNFTKDPKIEVREAHPLKIDEKRLIRWVMHGQFFFMVEARARDMLDVHNDHKVPKGRSGIKKVELNVPPCFSIYIGDR